MLALLRLGLLLENARLDVFGVPIRRGLHRVLVTALHRGVLGVRRGRVSVGLALRVGLRFGVLVHSLIHTGDGRIGHAGLPPGQAMAMAPWPLAGRPGSALPLRFDSRTQASNGVYPISSSSASASASVMILLNHAETIWAGVSWRTLTDFSSSQVAMTRPAWLESMPRLCSVLVAAASVLL